ncbi:MAG: hypothetical protein ACI8PZ_002702 [Myxococcota bacterium]|jgi:hypothetical protein
MARSLVVQKEETAVTSPLFTGFLLFAIACLALSMFGLATSDAQATPDVDAIVISD